MAFPERLTTYLAAEFPFVEPRAKLQGVSGSPYRVTAAAGSKDRPVYIQTASGQNTAAQRSAWRPEIMNLLSTVAYVGTWSARDQWTELVWGAAPESRLLLPLV